MTKLITRYKPLLVASIILIGLVISSSLAASTKVDPYITSANFGGSTFKAMSAGSISRDSTSTISIFIKARNVEAVKGLIDDLGGKVRAVAGQIMTATIDRNKIDILAESDAVLFIEGDKPLFTKNDVASSEINGTEAHAGMGLARAYTGKGVIVGLIDTGIDYKNHVFLDENGKSRIISVWDQNSASGTGPAEISNTYGTECLTESVANGSCTFKDEDGHGTHVAGTLAARDEKYGGMAPDANIVAVVYDSSLSLDNGYANTIFSTKICDAAYYVFEKAKALNMPAVVNMSLGTHLGAHDGTSLFEECLTNLVRGQKGRSIVAAAGNEYSSEEMFTGIHAGFTVDGKQATNFVIRKTSQDLIYYIDLWAEKDANIDVGLALHYGPAGTAPIEVSNLVSTGNTDSGKFLSGNVKYLINATESESALNWKRHVGITISLSSNMSTPSKYSFDLIVSGQGEFDAWLFPDKPAKIIQFTSASGRYVADWEFVSGDREKNVAIPSTAKDIISVTAYTTRTTWNKSDNCCQVKLELGDLLDFSASGPSANPASTGQKPDIAAPGGMIASTLSSDAIVNELLVIDSNYYLQAGTSMAAPFVAGTVALMFEANPNFTSEDVKNFITGSAYKDTFVNEGPINRWGAGKLDSLSALELAATSTPTISSQSADNPDVPNPSSSAGNGSSSSSGGCQLTATHIATPLAGSFVMIFIFLAPLGVLCRARRK